MHFQKCGNRHKTCAFWKSKPAFVCFRKKLCDLLRISKTCGNMWTSHCHLGFVHICAFQNVQQLTPTRPLLCISKMRRNVHHACVAIYIAFASLRFCKHAVTCTENAWFALRFENMWQRASCHAFQKHAAMCIMLVFSSAHFWTHGNPKENVRLPCAFENAWECASHLRYYLGYISIYTFPNVRQPAWKTHAFCFSKRTAKQHCASFAFRNV